MEKGTAFFQGMVGPSLKGIYGGEEADMDWEQDVACVRDMAKDGWCPLIPTEHVLLGLVVLSFMTLTDRPHVSV